MKITFKFTSKTIFILVIIVLGAGKNFNCFEGEVLSIPQGIVACISFFRYASIIFFVSPRRIYLRIITLKIICRKDAIITTDIVITVTLDVEVSRCFLICQVCIDRIATCFPHTSISRSTLFRRSKLILTNPSSLDCSLHLFAKSVL